MIAVGWVEEPQATKAHRFDKVVGLRRLRLLDPPYGLRLSNSSRTLCTSRMQCSTAGSP